MARSIASLLVSTLVAVALAGCSAASEGPDGADGTEVAAEQLRSVADGFFVRSPLTGARMEKLRQEVEAAEDGYSWTRNQGYVFGMQWESSKAVLTSAERSALVQAAFASRLSSNRRYLKNLEVVEASNEALDGALDVIGLGADNEESARVRTRITDAFRSAAKTRSITVMKASLDYQVDMYWEGALIIVDEENKQLIVATGGFGT